MKAESFRSRYIGDRAFYKALLALAMPVMLQTALTNFVSLLDNMMVGAVGTDQMNGVSIVNQLVFVYNLCIFGGLGGVGIFTAQFFGKGDRDGLRNTFRFKVILALVLCIAAALVLGLRHENLIALYLHEGSETGSIEETARWGREYLYVMLFGLLPFAVQQVYASTLRECGETLVPMKAGILAIGINLVLNWVLIFGHLGLPAMGAPGAALATVISRYVECAVIVVWAHRHPERAPFLPGAYRTLRVPKLLTLDILRRGMPLLINEALWSAGMAALAQSYSTRGLAVVASMNISNTASNLFNVVWMSMGTAVAIMVGQQLGAGEFDRARQSVRRIMVFSLGSALATGSLMFLMAPLFPRLYNTTEEVRKMATLFLRVTACATPLFSVAHVSYFTLRSGGRTWITFLFDSAYVWAVKIVFVRLLISLTSLGAVPVYALGEATDLLKSVVGAVLLKKGIWVRNIVNRDEE